MPRRLTWPSALLVPLPALNSSRRTSTPSCFVLAAAPPLPFQPLPPPLFPVHTPPLRLLTPPPLPRCPFASLPSLPPPFLLCRC